VVSYTINLLLISTTKRGLDPSSALMAAAVDARNTRHSIASG